MISPTTAGHTAVYAVICGTLILLVMRSSRLKDARIRKEQDALHGQTAAESPGTDYGTPRLKLSRNEKWDDRDLSRNGCPTSESIAEPDEQEAQPFALDSITHRILLDHIRSIA